LIDTVEGKLFNGRTNRLFNCVF